MMPSQSSIHCRSATWVLRYGIRALFIIALASLTLAQTTSRIQSLVSSGNLEGMRWPNFHDYQPILQEFYGHAGYAPAWLRGNTPSPQALSMIRLFGSAWEKGLEPEDYDASRWAGRLQALQGGGGNAENFDVALSVCSMRYISDLRIGRINPRHFQFGLDVQQKKYNLAEFVRERLLTTDDVSGLVASVEPHFAAYRRTEQALTRYVELARRSGNPGELAIPKKPVEPGESYPDVTGLVHILQLVGDLPANASQPANAQVYDGALVEAVKHFQRRHGLGDDGRLGAATVKQLNVPLSQRVRQLQLTLERWRWLPADFSAPPIIVNIPDFRLRALDENNNVAMDMRVVVGKALRTQTPVFSRDMSHVVLRPYWNVPPSILRGEIIPAIKRNRNYIADKNYEVTTMNGAVVTSGAISDDVLAQLQAGKLSVRQKPGTRNALGLVKLMFPNEHNVYLHSTPASQFFSRSRRDFSHGCIRVEKPAQLAAWTLRNNQGWTLDRVQQGMQQGNDNVAINLTRKVPVFILYGTALAYENNEVHFYDDIYGHDSRLAAALAKGYPYP